MVTLSSAFIGRGHAMVQCAEQWLERGHRIGCVVSDCEEVSVWARRRQLARVDPSQEERAFLGREPFEYLFSIVNHRVTSKHVLRLPTRAAINFHDSLLPRYAGFNATAWSILDGNRAHGITWHLMRDDVDAGEILKQVPIDVADDDTAFTLEAKCFEAAVNSFAELVDELGQGKLEGLPQMGARSFHFMSDRPDAACLLDWQEGTEKLERRIRALTFGPGDNSMGLAKIWDGEEPIWITDGSLGGPKDAAAGVVLGIEDGVLKVATGDRELLLAGLMDVTGTPLSAAGLRARGLEVGGTLPEPDRKLLASITDFDSSLRKAERFWVRRLARRVAPIVPNLQKGDAAPNRKEHPVQLSSKVAAALEGVAPDERLCWWAAAFALFLARVGELDTFDLDFDAGRVKGALSNFFATRVPLSVRVDKEASFASLLEAMRVELSELGRRQSHARDVIARYPELRRRLAMGELFALPVAFVRRSKDVSLDGAALVLSVDEDGLSARFHYDDNAFAAGDASTFFERFEWVSSAAWTDRVRAVGRLPVLLPRERHLLLEKWNATAEPYRKDRCVHELFEEQAARTADKVALVFGDRELTYAELNQRANVVARRLSLAGVGPETLVGICIERSIEMVIGLLGVLKAGAAYVPLDPVYPRERLSLMLADAAPPVLLTQRHLVPALPAHGAEVMCIDEIEWGDRREATDNPQSGVTPENLAYVIFTSGSTGRPKGVMVLHRNVSNFFTGMDGALGTVPGVWLAITSICFDISVLELFWTLARGFEVVIHKESDRASLGQRDALCSTHPARMGFGLFYFAADAADPRKAYRLLLEGAKFADENGFDAVWTPERHFHAFGGLYPNPAVTSAAIAAITTRVAIRAGSIVLPLHDPIRVAEEWSVVDNLSNGRVGLSFASGWHANDFVFKPDNFSARRDVMRDYIATVLKLWRGETIRVKNGEGKLIDIATLPRPVQAEPPLWVASAGNVDTFRAAGAMGVNVLTNMLGQSLGDLSDKIAGYRTARREAGHAGDGIVSVMLHTFVGPDTDEVRRLVKGPFCSYLATSLDLVKIAPWAFPAFKQPSKATGEGASLENLTPDDLQALMDHAFDRYFDTAGLFGTPDKALGVIDSLKRIGVNEVACLIDFGVDVDVVLRHLVHLKGLMKASQSVVAAAVPIADADYSIAQQLKRRKVTHLQCTPSMARMLALDAEALASLASLEQLLLGGEMLPADLADQMTSAVGGRVSNMYGPTETSVWSTMARIERGSPITIGRPIANTIVRLLDSRGELVPIGTPGELCIGGAGVVRGYLKRPDLTEERFIDDPHAPEGRLYRTGDLARFRPDGALEFLGRLDQQVKVNGYRIELGEIETVLARHSAVHQAVVVAREKASGGTQLVAYVVPSAARLDANSEQSVQHWQTLWDETYAQSRPNDEDAMAANGKDPRFDIAGWNSSYTGELIDPAAMSEWLEHTTRRILALVPKRVLEIGCGTGLLLYRLLPHVEHYTGVDFAEHALAQIRQELTAEEQNKVTLVQGTASTVAVIPGCDLVVINSVAQYFPSAAYLIDVIERAANLVVDGGHIWLGDIRSLPLLETFHTAVELHQAPAGTDAAALRARIAERAMHEAELVIDPRFFYALLARSTRLSGVEIQLKRGHHQNELTRFRYDVVLRVGSPTKPGLPLRPTPAPSALHEVRAMLQLEPDALWLTDLENARLSAELAVVRALGAGEAAAGTLRARLDDARAGIDPEALCRVHADYDVELRFPRSGALDRFDAVLRHRKKGPFGVVVDSVAVPKSAEAYANRPARSKSNEANIPAWRTYLREHLPEFMIPAVFVVLSELPLTPNGKIDRKALPVPDTAVRHVAAPYVAPASDIERTIAEMWEEMLGLPRVGLADNIFDLGANSLLTVQANGRLSKLLGRRISLVSMFQFPTIGSLAAHLAAPEVSSEAEQSGRERADRRKDALEHRRQVRTHLTKG